MMTCGTVATRNFEATETRQLLLTIRDSNGDALPVGANVLDDKGNSGTLIGDGNFMLENNAIGATLRVKAANRGECIVSYGVPEKLIQIHCMKLLMRYVINMSGSQQKEI